MTNLLKKELNLLNFREFITSGFVIQNPADSKVYLGILDNKLNNNTGFYTSSFYHNHFNYFSSSQIFQTDLNELFTWIQSNMSDSTKLEKIHDSDEDFKDDVQKCLHWINDSSELTKLVSVTKADYKFLNSTHPISKLKSLTEELNGYVYGKWFDGAGVLGVSPEPLFYDSGEHFNTMALAGTISTEISDYEVQILKDQKELSEHEFVIKDIIQKLEVISEKIEIAKTEVYNFGPIAHLKTMISFNFSGSCEELIRSLGPTAALGGYPSNMSFNFLRKTKYYESEKENRYFGGVYGLDLPGIKFGLVGIRNIYWDKDKAVIHSGSGIVNDSVVDKECSEVKAKRKTIEDHFING